MLNAGIFDLPAEDVSRLHRVQATGRQALPFIYFLYRESPGSGVDYNPRTKCSENFKSNERGWASLVNNEHEKFAYAY